MTITAKGEKYCSTTLCIDSYKNSVPTGRLYNCLMPEEKRFYGTTQFLLEMERILDSIEFPLSHTAPRRFASPTDGDTGPPKTEFRSGEVGNFAVRVLFRQNASWQGSLTWMEGRQEQSFRSVLELILLMDNALSYTSAS